MLPMYECCVDCCYSIPAGPVVEQGTELAKSAARPHPRRRPALVVVPTPPTPPFASHPFRSCWEKGPTTLINSASCSATALRAPQSLRHHQLRSQQQPQPPSQRRVRRSRQQSLHPWQRAGGR